MNMKSNKVILVACASLLLAASCNKVEGPTGTAAAGFSSAEIQKGLGSEYIYIPISVAGDATAYPCTVKVEVKDYTGEFAAKEDVDYFITSKEIVIASAESKPNIEIRIINPEDADELRFALDLKDVQTPADMVSSTIVKCAKSELDRICGTYVVSGTNDGSSYQENWKVTNENGKILISGIFGESGAIEGEYENGLVTFELGGDNMTGAYQFSGIGNAYVGPYFGYKTDDGKYRAASGSLVGKVSADFKSIEWQIQDPYGLIEGIFSYDETRRLLGVYQGPFFIKNNTITKAAK